MERRNFIAMFLAAGTLWAAAPPTARAGDILIGEVNGLEFRVKFLNPGDKSPAKSIVFKKGQPFGFRLTVKNRSNRSVPQAEIQTSLHVQEASCPEILPGSRLPGPSISLPHQAALAPGVSSYFDHIYTPPATLCDLTGYIQVHLTYTQRGVIKAESLISPVPFRLE